MTKTAKETFQDFFGAVNTLKKEIKYEIGYVLCEASFRIDERTNGCFDDELEVKDDCSLFNRFLIWLSWHLYHNGCWFYT